ncbi:MAG: PKD domain-containing protein [Acidimicrobiia bacterium]|nr:PKD domain-containing protein [Acidimicrobiia bacterium]
MLTKLTQHLRSTRRSAIRFGTAAGALAILGSACGTPTEIAATTAVEPPTASADPVVNSLDLVVSGETATMIANVTDPDDDIASVSVEWGDGETDTVTAGFPGLRADHEYEEAGPYTVVVQVTDETGWSNLATALVEIAETESGSAGEGEGEIAPPAPAPAPEPAPQPAPEPAPQPAPAPTPEPTPMPLPDPIALDLLDEQVTYSQVVDAEDGAGGSGEARSVGSRGLAVRSYAWHGYNGRGYAEATLTRVIDASSAFEQFGEHVTAIEVELDYAASGTGKLRGPWDRSSTVSVWASIDAEGAQDSELFTATKSEDDFDPVLPLSFDDEGRTTSFVLTPENPTATFQLSASCTSTGGPMAFALLNEGWCDFYDDNGKVELIRLQATLFPVV